LISFRDVKKSFGDRRILDGVSFDVNPGEVFFVIGASGVGKSVMIKQLIGLLSPDTGEIWLDGEEVSRFDEQQMYAVRKKCAMVFQHSTLFDQTQMRKFAERFPNELGDGMKKRVAIARALSFQPKYVLFDEPTTSLDPVSARRVDRLIRDLSDRLKVTSIVVSHDLPSIFGIADRIVMLYKGKVRLLGTPSDFRNTEDPVIVQFVNGRAEGPIE
jgi:phospholipid/cholesterol/gamma-HCH transport system ATP-binding protein